MLKTLYNQINEFKNIYFFNSWSYLPLLSRENIVLVAGYNPYRQSAEVILSILVSLWLLWLQTENCDVFVL